MWITNWQSTKSVSQNVVHCCILQSRVLPISCTEWNKWVHHVNILSGELVLFPKLHTDFLLNFITYIHTKSCQVNLIINYSITLCMKLKSKFIKYCKSFPKKFNTCHKNLPEMWHRQAGRPMHNMSEMLHMGKILHVVNHTLCRKGWSMTGLSNIFRSPVIYRIYCVTWSFAI